MRNAAEHRAADRVTNFKEQHRLAGLPGERPFLPRRKPARSVYVKIRNNRCQAQHIGPRCTDDLVAARPERFHDVRLGIAGYARGDPPHGFTTDWTSGVGGVSVALPIPVKSDSDRVDHDLAVRRKLYVRSKVKL